MKRFEYEVTSYRAETFKELVYFCSGDGQCNIEMVPSDQLKKIESMLNGRGQDGWEIVQLSFGKDGILAFWKRMIGDREEFDRMETIDMG